MSIDRINPDLCPLVSVHRKKKTDYKYEEAVEDKCIFFGLILWKGGQEEGFYKQELRSLSIKWDGEDVDWDKHDLGPDDFIYVKPTVRIHCGRRVVTRYFDTFEEAYGFAVENFPNNKLKIEQK